MVNRILFLSAFLFLLIFSGCGSSVPLAAPEQDSAAKSFPKPPDGKAGLYVYRNNALDIGGKKAIYLDGFLIGETSNTTFLYRPIRPGQHTLLTQSDFGYNDISFHTDVNKNYYVQQVMWFGYRLHLISEDTGRSEVLKCRLAAGVKDTTVIDNHTLVYNNLLVKANNLFPVEKIFTRGLNGFETLTPKDGYRLLVAPLYINAIRYMDIEVQAQDFKAVHEKDTLEAKAIGQFSIDPVTNKSSVVWHPCGDSTSIKYSERQQDFLLLYLCFATKKGTDQLKFFCAEDPDHAVDLELKDLPRNTFDLSGGRVY